jgi:predicted enzyme related to lactoylglutathione lyase
MLNFNSIMFGSQNPQALADFYAKVLERKPDFTDGEWSGFNAGACMLSFGPHDKVQGKSQNPERLILNFETDHVKEEFERIKELGAHVVTVPYQMGEVEDAGWIATFSDPDGNYFQLMTPWKM